MSDGPAPEVACVRLRVAECRNCVDVDGTRKAPCRSHAKTVGREVFRVMVRESGPRCTRFSSDCILPGCVMRLHDRWSANHMMAPVTEVRQFDNLQDMLREFPDLKSYWDDIVSKAKTEKKRVWYLARTTPYVVVFWTVSYYHEFPFRNKNTGVPCAQCQAMNVAF